MRRGILSAISIAALFASVGTVSAATLSELQEQLKALTAQIAILQSQQKPAPQNAAACPQLNRNLWRGSRGDDVRQLQQFLISQNLLASDSATGFYGALTEGAVKKLQCNQRVVCSGTAATTGYGAVGPKTRALILKVCPSQTSRPPGTIIAPIETMSPNSPLIPPTESGSLGSGSAAPFTSPQNPVPPSSTPTPSVSRPPTITTITPSAGPAGTLVTLTGYGFTPTGNHVGITNDYMQLFVDSAPWVNAASQIRIFELPLNIEKLPDSALQKIISYLNRHNIGLAIAVAMLPVTDTCPVNEGASTRDYSQVAERIKKLGGDVKYIVGDQPLYTGNVVCNLSPTVTAQKAAVTAKKIKAVFPNVRVTQTEPVAIPDWRGDPNILIAEYLSSFKTAFGEPVTSVQMDIFWRNPELAWQSPVTQFANTLKAQGVASAAIYNSDAGALTDSEWLVRARQNYQAYEALAGQPIAAIFQSWNKYPFRSLPETSPNAFTFLINQYVGEHGANLPELWFSPQSGFDEIWSAAAYVPNSGQTISFSIPTTLPANASPGAFSIFAQNGNTGTFSNDVTLTITTNTSPDGAILQLGSNSSLVTSQGTWTFGSTMVANDAMVLLNRQSAAGGYAIKLVVAQGGKMFAMSADQNWYVWSGSGWAQATNPYPPTPSPDGSYIVPDVLGSLTTVDGTWTFSTEKDPYGNSKVLLNGSSAANGSCVKLVVAQGGKMFAYSNGNEWWRWTGSGWTAASNPL